MTDKTIMSGGNIGGDYFFLYYLRSSKYKLEHYLTFNKDLYYIYKSSDNQKEVSYKEFIDFKYSQYIFFKKSKYNNIEINKWIEWFVKNDLIMKYLTKPLPPIEIIDKIKIKK